MTSIPATTQIATAVQSTQVHNKIDFAVAQKQQEAAKQSGEAAVQLVKAAASTATPQLDVQA